MSLFAFKDLNYVSQSPDQARGLQADFEVTMFERGTTIKQLKKTVGEIQPGTVIQFCTGGQWSMHELLHYILLKTGPAKVCLSTWTITEQPLRTILDLHKRGLITELNCLFDHRIKERTPKAFQLAQGIVHKMKLTKIHAKVTVVENDQWGVAIIGSANLSRNPRIEAGVIFTDKVSAAFNRSWIMEEINNLQPFRK